MKLIMRLFSLSLFFSASIMAADLTVNVSHIEQIKGKVHIGLFIASSDFPNSAGQWRGKIISVNKASVNTTFTDLPSDDYAVAVFQDLNNNQILDTNFFGIPKEPYGFSGGNPTMGAPDFDEAKFSLAEDDEQSIKVELK